MFFSITIFSAFHKTFFFFTFALYVTDESSFGLWIYVMSYLKGTKPLLFYKQSMAQVFTNADRVSHRFVSWKCSPCSLYSLFVFLYFPCTDFAMVTVDIIPGKWWRHGLRKKWEIWRGMHLISDLHWDPFKGLAISEGKGPIFAREQLIEIIFRELPSKGPTIIKCKHLWWHAARK